MGETTGITWTDHTFSPWWGCTKISAGCDNCYALAWDRRWGGNHWGKGAERRVFGEKHWREPLKWNAAAEKAGRRARVFCASMADVFDAEAPAGQLERLWALIRATPHLDWQLLTKRPARIARSLPADWSQGYANVWLGTTVENQEQAGIRIPVLLEVPARVRFLSCEPLLEQVRLDRIELVAPKPPYGLGVWLNAFTGLVIGPDDVLDGRISWVIVGGESGNGARPCAMEWLHSLMAQCKAAQVPCFVRQMGAHVVSELRIDADGAWAWRAGLTDRKGADPEQFPELRTRQFPEVRDV